MRLMCLAAVGDAVVWTEESGWGIKPCLPFVITSSWPFVHKVLKQQRCSLFSVMVLLICCESLTLCQSHIFQWVLSCKPHQKEGWGGGHSCSECKYLGTEHIVGGTLCSRERSGIALGHGEIKLFPSVHKRRN